MIHYVIGDATKPDGYRPAGEGLLVAHVCNDAGGWGAGFTKAISGRWSFPEIDYREAAAKGPLVLGTCQLVAVSPSRRIDVVNMIAQHGYSKPHAPAIRYGALFRCLEILANYVRSRRVVWETGTTVHMPRIGCGLAGGIWDVVESLINEALPDDEVFVYDLPQR